MIKPPSSAAVGGGVYAWSNSEGASGSASNLPKVSVIQGVFTSVKTPGWKAMTKSERRRVNNPYTYILERTHYGEGRDQGTIGRSYGFMTFSGAGTASGLSYTGSGDHRFPSNKNVRTDAQSKALSRLQTQVARSSVNLAQAYAERKQAVDMIYKRAWEIANLALSIRHGDFDDVRKRLTKIVGRTSKPSRQTALQHDAAMRKLGLLKGSAKQAREVGSVWLEVQYGWKPLLSDIYGSCEAIAKTYHEKRPYIVTSSASAEAAFSNVPGFARSNGSSLQSQRWKWNMDESCRYVVQFAEDEPILTALASTGLTNPALLAWELLPYSFVIDWFLPVGNYLQQLEYARGLKFVSGTFSRKVRAAGVSSWTVSNPNPNGTVYNTFDYPIGWTLYEKSRSKLTSWPYQDFPSFQPKLGVERVLNATALITQALTGGVTKQHRR